VDPHLETDCGENEETIATTGEAEAASLSDLVMDVAVAVAIAVAELRIF